ncbi:MAG TPA: DUF1707 domain-containing protein [Solirubrobacteraceae bacterium]|nr:DUF1707 domain-containing protein [Solirubrobacteraceae bacterium]
MSDPSTMRVADADRERLAGELREHMVAGRLSQEELEERVDLAYKAKTQADLDALRADLPMSPAAVQQSLAERRAHLRRRLLQEAGGSLTASGVCVAIWLANGAQGQFWPIWVIVFSLVPFLRGAWHLFGPAPDEKAFEESLQRRRARHLAHERRHARQHRSLPR